jgi:hypothetical protein
MVQQLMSKGWQFLCGKFGGNVTNTTMNNAMNLGQQSNSPAAIIDMFKSTAKNNGMENEMNKVGHILDSFANKQPNQIVPHAIALLNEHGKMGALTKFLFGGNNNASP